MSKSQRTIMLEKKLQESAKNPPVNHYEADLHYAAIHTYGNLEKWEKIARATHDALVNQALYIHPYDAIIGRVYFEKKQEIAAYSEDLEFLNGPFEKIHREIEHYDEMCDYQFFCKGESRGHIAWLWDCILRHGVSGMRQLYQKNLQCAKDNKAREFYSGVLIVLDAITVWNHKHVIRLKEMNMEKMANLCERVPEYPATTFHEAIQAFYMQYIMVLSENPYGGNSPGRLDYYLWPYLEEDLKNGVCSMETARDLMDELFLRLDESVHNMDGWGITISIGGCHQNGSPAINPLTYLMVDSIMDLNITHPLVYLRVPKNAPSDYLFLCARYMKNGQNRAQIISDDAMIKAMTNSGILYADATNYVCGGCMEISPQGMNSDFLFNGWHNIPKLVELSLTGGKCLRTGQKVQSSKFKGLAAYADFDSFYRDFEAEVTRVIHLYFEVQDMFSKEAAVSRPAYLLSSMLKNCLSEGRNMHDGGVIYHNYGSAPIGLPNAADALYAVKKAVFDDHLCDATALLHALETNFEKAELLRLQLQHLPKYGQQHEEADQMAARLMTSVATSYSSYHNRLGGTALPMVLTFTFGPEAANILGATADGNHAGKMIAQGLTPQSSSMKDGVTAAILSNLKMPMELFTGGASTMWDFDSAWVTEPLLASILDIFLEGGGQIFQGNTTDVKQLLAAQKNPEDYSHLIVRVGGFSARFTSLSKELQEDIITRHRHAI